MKTYTLLVCPLCRSKLTFVGNDEGMFSRATCCDRQWFRPSDANWTAGGGRPETAALEITVSEPGELLGHIVVVRDRWGTYDTPLGLGMIFEPDDRESAEAAAEPDGYFVAEVRRP